LHYSISTVLKYKTSKLRLSNGNANERVKQLWLIAVWQNKAEIGSM